MSDKTRIAVILGTIGLAGAAGLGYFVKVYLPTQKATAAQAEITAWEERLTAARTCLLGPTPASGKSGEALAVRELSPDPWERGTCTKLIGKLSRGMADDTGLLPVEHAWMAIDRSASRVATAFATHVDPMGETGDKRGKPSPLPEALEALDDAHAALRQAAGMSPPPAASIPALPAAQELTIGEGKDRVTRFDLTVPSAGGLVGFGDLEDGRQVQLVLAPGAPPRAMPVASGTLRALPTGTWGARGTTGAVEIGALDEAGALATPTALPLEGPATIIAAMGSATDGLVVTADRGGRLVFARARGGAFTADPPLPISGGTSAQDVDGRTLLAWSVDGDIRGLLVHDGAAATPVALGAGDPRVGGCLTATTGWFSTGDQFISFDGAAATPHVLPDHALVGCGPAAALLRSTSTHFAVCTEACRPVDLTGVRWTSAATVVEGKVVAVAAQGHVLGVWREGAPTTYFATTSELRPRYAMTDGKVIDVIATTDDGVMIARIPAR